MEFIILFLAAGTAFLVFGSVLAILRLFIKAIPGGLIIALLVGGVIIWIVIVWFMVFAALGGPTG